MTEEFKPCIVVPTYNEAANIKSFIEEVFKVAPDICIFIVDDNSPDNTAQIVHSMCDKRIFILKRSKKLGLASAYIDGFRYAKNKGFNAFIEMDADFSHNPKYLPVMIENLKKYDFVIGSRNVKGGSVEDWGIIRNLISKAGSIYSRLVLFCPIKDLTGGFNGWNLRVIDKIGMDNIISKGYSFQIEMKYKAYKKGFKYFEFPIVFTNRKLGESKMSKEIFFEAVKNVFKIRNSK